MDRIKFNSLLNEIRTEMNAKKRIIDKALNEEFSKGVPIKFERIEKILNDYENVGTFKNENQKIAVCYDGRPEVTLTYVFDSMIYNNTITYCVNGNKKINKVLMEIVLDSLMNTNIKNDWIDYDERYNEIHLRDNEKVFDKLVYVGDYYEYKMFASFFKKPVEYNNYGYIKLYIDKNKHNDEYKKINEYAYLENIYLEVYNDVQDFLLESKKDDYAVLYLDNSKLINQAQKFIRAKDLRINSFPFNEYKFKIKR